MTLTLKTNMLAFSRSLELSDGLMQAGNWDCAQEAPVPVEVRRIGVRGQTSNASSKTDKENWGASNPQRVDVATMPPERDMLLISFTLRVLANSRRPFATDCFEVAKSYGRLAEAFEAAGGYAELARRYLSNIANGRFAWRNASLADEAHVGVSWAGTTVRFDPTILDLTRVPTLSDLEAAVADGAENLAGLLDAFSKSLSNPAAPMNLNVTWRGRVNELAQVYPSQVYPGTDVGADGKGKTLAKIRRRVASRVVDAAILHQQKIGSAIRWIDDWHGVEEFGTEPVPANPYAGVQEMGVALRAKGRNNPITTPAKSLYDILAKPAALETDMQSGTIGPEFFFVMANLVRGGVFGDKG